MREGGVYIIRYRSQAGNYRWYEKEMIASFIGKGRDGETLYFSLRPLAGTQDFDRARIISITPTTQNKKLPVTIRRIPKEEIER